MIKLIREMDKQFRINIPNQLMEHVKLQKGEKVAFCQHSEGMMIRKMNNLQDCRVIGFATLDSKGRFIVQKDLRVGIKQFELFILNNELILKEAD